MIAFYKKKLGLPLSDSEDYWKITFPFMECRIEWLKAVLLVEEEIWNDISARIFTRIFTQRIISFDSTCCLPATYFLILVGRTMSFMEIQTFIQIVGDIFEIEIRFV